MLMTCNSWACSDKVANTPPFLKHGLSPSRCHEELSKISGGLKILDHVGIAMVVVMVVAMVEVNLNEVEEAGIVDVVVGAAGGLLEEGVEIVVVADRDLIEVVVGLVEAVAASYVNLVKGSWGHVTPPPLKDCSSIQCQ